MITPSANIRRTIRAAAIGRPREIAEAAPRRARRRRLRAEPGREVTGERDRGGERHRHRRGPPRASVTFHDQRSGRSPTRTRPPSTAPEHPGELERVEAASKPSALGLSGERAVRLPDHDQGVSEAGEDPAQDQHRQRARGGESSNIPPQEGQPGRGSARSRAGRRGECARGQVRPAIAARGQNDPARTAAAPSTGSLCARAISGRERAEGADADRCWRRRRGFSRAVPANAVSCSPPGAVQGSKGASRPPRIEGRHVRRWGAG